jgi:penicillin amidase
MHRFQQAFAKMANLTNRLIDGIRLLYLSTDCIPPHRARRITERLSELDTFSIETMKPIFGDLLSIPAGLFIEKLKTLSLSDRDAAALRDRIVGWDARMDAHSVAAAAYSMFRVQVTRVVGESCKLVLGCGERPMARVD